MIVCYFGERRERGRKDRGEGRGKGGERREMGMEERGERGEGTTQGRERGMDERGEYRREEKECARREERGIDVKGKRES